MYFFAENKNIYADCHYEFSCEFYKNISLYIKIEFSISVGEGGEMLFKYIDLIDLCVFFENKNTCHLVCDFLLKVRS